MTTLRISPHQYFEVNGQICPVNTVGDGYAVASGTEILPGIADVRIRVMGFIAQSQSAADSSAVRFRNGAAGAYFGSLFVINGNTTPGYQPFMLPIFEGGYFETDTGISLNADVSVQNVFLTVFYIRYRPQ